MLRTYESFIKEIKNKKVLFCGIGRSNLPFMQMLTEESVDISVYDAKTEAKISQEILENLKANKNITLRLADESVFDEFFDVVIRTPGISYLSEKIQKLKNNGSAVTSEMEIFFELCPCPIIGITGSDGKTTTTTVISKILENAGKTVHLGGNIGKPLLPNIKNIKEDDIAVAELSSFQLMSMRQSPQIAVVTNISPNHLDFHKDMDEYVTAKKQIIFHQSAFSRAILNYDNEGTRKMAPDVRGNLLFFSTKEKLDSGVWVNSENEIIFSKNGKNTKVLNANEIKLPGKHNLENYLAAIAATFEIAGINATEKTAKTFAGVAHRMEFVRNYQGVSYYNDSIASTPTRTINGALSLFNQKVILIAGGYDKKVPFDNFAKEIAKKVSAVILMGNTKEKILNEIMKLPENERQGLKIFEAQDMQEAVETAKKESKPGGTVILSPACASFDLYKDFEERGNHFKSIVKNII